VGAGSRVKWEWQAKGSRIKSQNQDPADFRDRTDIGVANNKKGSQGVGCLK